jgi:hypothetical protein
MFVDLEIKSYLEVVCLCMLLGESAGWHTVGQGCRREGEVAGRVGRTRMVGSMFLWALLFVLLFWFMGVG